MPIDKALAFIESELALAKLMVEFYGGNPPEFDWKGSVEILTDIKWRLELTAPPDRDEKVKGLIEATRAFLSGPYHYDPEGSLVDELRSALAEVEEEKT